MRESRELPPDVCSESRRGDAVGGKPIPEPAEHCDIALALGRFSRVRQSHPRNLMELIKVSHSVPFPWSHQATAAGIHVFRISGERTLVLGTFQGMPVTSQFTEHVVPNRILLTAEHPHVELRNPLPGIIGEEVRQQFHAIVYVHEQFH
jgi:hypothetical protein